MKKNIIIGILAILLFAVSVIRFQPVSVSATPKAMAPSGEPIEVNQWRQIYVPEETDLALALRDAANNNNRTGWIRVSFADADYGGGNDSPVYVDLVMVETHQDPEP